MKNDEYTLTITDFEKRILTVALTRLQESQKLEDKEHEFLNGIINKIFFAPKVKRGFRFNAKQKER